MDERRNDPEMDERRDDPEQELDCLLEEGFSAPPPEDILQKITPWRRAMNFILAGLVLSTVTLNFWNLDIILPAAGHVLILLGLRPLRRENRAFRVWWFSLLLQTGLRAFSLLRQAAPGWRNFCRTPLGLTLTGLNIALQLLQYLCLWQGLRTVRRGAGLNPQSGPALALAVWYFTLTALALLGMAQVGWPFFLILLAVYACIINSLQKLSREMDESGYALRPVPVRVPDWLLAGTICVALLLGIAAVSLACSRLPMDWQPIDSAEHSEADVENLKAQLAGLGFPEDVLDDLSAGDLRACGGAVRVVVDTDTFALTNAYHKDAPMPLKITGVAVELAGERERWRIFHHFRWDTGVSFYGSEAMQFWPAYHIAEGWAKSGEATGRVLCEREGAALWSPYYSLGEETFTSANVFFGTRTSTDLFASFSFPRNGENCRGYVTYETAENRDGCIIDSWVNYAHARWGALYPALTAAEWIQNVGLNVDSEPFRFVQDALQFYPPTVDEEGVY